MISLILLAGGKGTRFGGDLPKQYQLLNGLPVILHSLKVFQEVEAISEIVVVCEEEFRPLFSSFDVEFALPGARRQDSVENGFSKCTHPWICVHDGARPLITKELCLNLFEKGMEIGAATLGVPSTSTLREKLADAKVKTLDRTKIYEIQTPQFLSRALLEKGLEKVKQEALNVTDDVAFAELLGHPIDIVMGAYANIKITTPADLQVAEQLCKK